MKILVINAGSSSLKYQLFDTIDGSVLAKGLCERIGMDGGHIKHTTVEQFNEDIQLDNHGVAIRRVIELLTDGDGAVLSGMEEIDAVGHRVLHGGMEFSGSIMCTDAVIDAIKRCIPLGPLHNPANLTGILACQEAMGDIPQVAVFDTAFHQTIPEHAFIYALPYEYYEKYQIRRYGFHGTSHRYVSAKAAEILGKNIEDLKIVTCHLGNGSSIAAVSGGKCIDTSMGLTPLEGLPMGTRSGSIDPAILQTIMDNEGIESVSEMVDILNKKSGMLGISGISNDFRDLIAASATEPRAKLALDVFNYSIKKYIGSYAAAMGGLDVIVFTAGVGENNTGIRADAVSGLEFMGVSIDPTKNGKRGTVDISTDDARVKVLVIPTDEEYVIAVDTEEIVSAMKAAN